MYEPDPGDPPTPPLEGGDEIPEEEQPTEGRVKYVVDDVEVSIVAERVQYYGHDGRLITEDLREYTRRNILRRYRSLEEFLRVWTGGERKRAIIEELTAQGVLLEELADEVGREFDAFDLVCHVAYDRPPLTRRERAANVRKRDVFTKYGEAARAVLDALLDKYADAGIEEIEDPAVLRVQPIDRLGTPLEIIARFGGREEYLEAVRELGAALYAA